MKYLKKNHVKAGMRLVRNCSRPFCLLVVSHVCYPITWLVPAQLTPAQMICKPNPVQHGSTRSTHNLEFISTHSRAQFYMKLSSLSFFSIPDRTLKFILSSEHCKEQFESFKEWAIFGVKKLIWQNSLSIVLIKLIKN